MQPGEELASISWLPLAFVNDAARSGSVGFSATHVRAIGVSFT